MIKEYTKCSINRGNNRGNFVSEMKKIQGFDFDLWPSNDLSSGFVLDKKQTLPVGAYMWDMIEQYHKCSVK